MPDNLTKQRKTAAQSAEMEEILESESSRRHNYQRRKIHFERAICLGDIVSVLLFIGSIGAGVWFMATQSSKIDRVSTTQDLMQNTVVTLQTDVGSIKTEVHDLHDWIKAGK